MSTSTPFPGDIGTGNIKLAKTANVDNEEEAVDIELRESVELSFACRWYTFKETLYFVGEGGDQVET